MRPILTTVTTALLFCAVPGLMSHAHAHGGAYRGPAGEVPPGSREPHDPPPPPEGGGPTTPGGEPTNGPTTPGGGVGGPPTGGDGGGGGPKTGGAGPAPTSGGNGGLGPRTGPGAPSGRAKGPGYEDWTFWWNFNKDDILQLKSATARPAIGTGSAVHGLGKTMGRGGELRSATDTAIWNEIVPALRTLLDDDDLNFDIRSAAALALAKIGDLSIVPQLQEMARNDGSRRVHLVVEESAALALGLLQDRSPEAISFLIDLVNDSDRDASRVRPFAAISLGLLGVEKPLDAAQFESVRQCLVDVVARKQTKTDLRPCALLALGLLGNDAAVPDLVRAVETRQIKDGADRLDVVDVAFAVQALGKIGAIGCGDEPTRVVDLVVDLVAGRGAADVDTNVARSAVIALGQLAPACDLERQTAIAGVLTKIVRTCDDASQRNFALIALGRMGGVQGADAEMQNDVVKTLRRFLDERGGGHLTQPFAALAMGLAGRSMPAAEEAVRKPLRKKFADATKGDPRPRGAYAIASGLTRDVLAVDGLVAVLQAKNSDSGLRGYSAVALGLIGDDGSRDAIRAALADDSDRDLRVQTAVAAGLMGDAGVVDDLVAILREGEGSQYVLGSVALALGQIGDERAVPPLLRMAADRDKKVPAITRALATVALGQIGDRHDVPLLARVGRDINFRAIGAVPSLTELLSIL